jgi:sigma-B regulation protein RsbU (phosphoserine phosphatase)
MSQEEKNFQVIREIEHTRVHGELIGKIASSFCYVDEETLIDDLASDLDKHKEIFELAVLSEGNEVEGIIIRRDFTETLSKPYARDVYKHKKVRRLMKLSRKIDYRENIFALVEDFKDTMNQVGILSFILTRNKNQYFGIFTNRDLLLYLSSITQKDISLARKLQQSLVSEEKQVHKDGIEIYAASHMAKEVGGDFYYMKKYTKTNWTLSVCDVSGKGVSASLVTTLLSGTFEIYDFTKGIREYVRRINGFIHQSFEHDKFVTGIIIDLNEETGEIELMDMGHSYIYIIRNGKMHHLEYKNQNLPIGVDEIGNDDQENYKSIRYQLQPDDILMLLTDGIPEQSNQDNEEYGIKRLSALLKAETLKESSLKQIKNAVFEDLNRYRSGVPIHDDFTLMLIRWENPKAKN